ncbi:MAG TPA: aldo/keto reductase [Clostridiales bacterium]|nr:aldo/keto reductase [Clostridiales bacterium]
MIKYNPDLYGMAFTYDEFHGMPWKQIGNSGLRAPVIGLGAWKFGYPETGDGARVTEKEALALLDKAWEEGVLLWDTANRYNASSGNSERVLGTWFVKNPEKRRDVILCTKMFGSMDGKTPNHCRLSRNNIKDAVYACLERMQTDYIDLLYFHQFDAYTPVEESLSAIEDLVAGDYIRYLGVSNFSKENMELYEKTSNSMSIRTRVVAVQNKFDLLHGEYAPNDGVLDFCAKHNVAFIPHGPLASGLLTDRYLDASKVGKGDRLFDEGTYDPGAMRSELEKVAAIKDLASEYDMTVSEMSLAYMLTLDGMGCQIPGATSTEQLVSNAKAGKVTLSDDARKGMKRITGIG